MDAHVEAICRSQPQIDKAVKILVYSLQRAVSEGRTGTVEILVPIKEGTLHAPKEVTVIYHNS